LFLLIFFLVVPAASNAQTAPSTATTYPARPIRLIVGSSAGGGGDGVARVTAAKLTALLKQQMVVDNRNRSASGVIAVGGQIV